MSIQDYKWSDDDLSFDSLDIMEGEKSLWLAVRQPFRSDTVVNLEISDAKALAAHFELDAEHKAALADYERITTLQMNQNRRQEAELEKARELLRRGRIAAQFMANEKLDRDIKSYLGDKT